MPTRAESNCLAIWREVMERRKFTREFKLKAVRLIDPDIEIALQVVNGPVYFLVERHAMETFADSLVWPAPMRWSAFSLKS
jgi:hypothetical protein